MPGEEEEARGKEEAIGETESDNHHKAGVAGKDPVGGGDFLSQSSIGDGGCGDRREQGSQDGSGDG